MGRSAAGHLAVQQAQQTGGRYLGGAIVRQVFRRYAAAAQSVTKLSGCRTAVKRMLKLQLKAVWRYTAIAGMGDAGQSRPECIWSEAVVDAEAEAEALHRLLVCVPQLYITQCAHVCHVFSLGTAVQGQTHDVWRP